MYTLSSTSRIAIAALVNPRILRVTTRGTAVTPRIAAIVAYAARLSQPNNPKVISGY